MIFRRIGRRPGRDLTIMTTLFPAAEAASRADGVDTAGAEYLLLAAIDLEDGSARRAFRRVGVDPYELRRAIREQHADALRRIGVTGVDDAVLDRHLREPKPATGPVKIGPSAHAMFRAVVEQVRDDASQLYSAYFVLAATDAAHGTAIRAIRHLGVDPAELARAACAEIAALAESPPP